MLDSTAINKNFGKTEITFKGCMGLQPLVGGLTRVKPTIVLIQWYSLLDLADGYEIYRSTSKNGEYTKIGVAGKTNGTANSYYFDTTADKNERYYYKVKAYKRFGNVKFYSHFSQLGLKYKTE